MSKHDERRTVKSTVITHTHTHKHTHTHRETHTHTEVHYGMSPVSSGPQCITIFISLWSNNHAWPREQKCCIELWLCTLDMTAEYRKLDTEPCH